MKNFILILSSVLIAFFHTSVVGNFFDPRRMPDLALSFVVVLVLTLGFKASLKWILLTGAMIDAGSVTVFGTLMLSFLLIGWTVSLFAKIADIRSKKFFSLSVFAAIVAAGEIIKDFFLLGSLRIEAYSSGRAADYGIVFNQDYLFKIIYTVIAAYMIYYIFRKISQVFFVEPVKLARETR